MLPSFILAELRLAILESSEWLENYRLARSLGDKPMLEDLHVKCAFRQAMRSRAEALFHRLTQLSRSWSRQWKASVLSVLLDFYKSKTRTMLDHQSFSWRQIAGLTLLEVCRGRLRAARDLQFARARHRWDVSRSTAHEHGVCLHFRRRWATVRALDVAEVLRNSFGARAFSRRRASSRVARRWCFIFATRRRARRLKNEWKSCFMSSANLGESSPVDSPNSHDRGSFCCYWIPYLHYLNFPRD